MKQLISYLLIITIGWHLFAELTVYVSFKINQDYIAKYLCINKDDPESTCHGCCQLKKELEKQQEQKQDLPQTENKKVEIQYFTIETEQLCPLYQHLTRTSFFYIETIGVTASNRIFHPPQMLLA